MARPKSPALLTVLLPLCLFESLAFAQQGDGGAADGYSNSNLGSAGSGADGSSSSSANLNKGAIIAIAVVVAVVVIGGVSLAVLFYLSKKRQWEVRKTIRRTTTKVVRAMTPRTATFGKGVLSPRADKQGHTFMHKNKDLNEKHGDVEKGFKAQDGELRSSQESDSSKAGLKQPQRQVLHSRQDSEADTNKRLPKPKPTIDVPRSHFDMDDSPMKSPMWQRLLGRK